MTYSTGGLIQATDYNGFVSTTAGANVNATLSAYGQATLSTVAAGTDTVSATQWSTLNTRIASLATHQGTTITSRTGPTAGTTISVQSAINTDLTSIYTNRFNATSQGSQVTSWTGTTSKTTDTGSGSSPWQIVFTHTITFANATAATSFFNAGGVVKVQFGKASTGTVADTEWNSFIGANGAGGTVAAAVYLTADATSKTIPQGSSLGGTFYTGGTGTPTIGTAIGYNQLTGTPQTIYQQYDSVATYTGNYVQIDAAQNSSGVLTLTTTWNDDGGAGAGSTDQITAGTSTDSPLSTWGTGPATVVTYFPPESTNITNTWGTPTIAASVA